MHLLPCRCDTGFGNALAKSLYKRGVPVFAGCLMKSSATKLQEETGHSLKTVIIDVTDVASITKAVEYVKENLPNGAGKTHLCIYIYIYIYIYTLYQTYSCVALRSTDLVCLFRLDDIINLCQLPVMARQFVKSQIKRINELVTIQKSSCNIKAFYLFIWSASLVWTNSINILWRMID